MNAKTIGIVKRIHPKQAQAYPLYIKSYDNEML